MGGPPDPRPGDPGLVPARPLSRGRADAPDGRFLGAIIVPETPANLCFGGADRRTLFATDAVPGGVWAWEGLPTPGLPVLAWPAPAD